MMRSAGWLAIAAILSGCSTADPQPNASEATADQQPAPLPPTPTRTPSDQKPVQANPCRLQDGKTVAYRLKALGTEPFWAAEVDGRCVTYKTPEDQQGTRVWARVSADGSVWEGALDDRQFQLTVRPAPGCSDGMSDRTYPQEAVLRVKGETRRGCAEPL